MESVAGSSMLLVDEPKRKIQLVRLLTSRNVNMLTCWFCIFAALHLVACFLFALVSAFAHTFPFFGVSGLTFDMDNVLPCGLIGVFVAEEEVNRNVKILTNGVKCIDARFLDAPVEQTADGVDADVYALSYECSMKFFLCRGFFMHWVRVGEKEPKSLVQWRLIAHAAARPCLLSWPESWLVTPGMAMPKMPWPLVSSSAMSSGCVQRWTAVPSDSTVVSAMSSRS